MLTLTSAHSLHRQRPERQESTGQNVGQKRMGADLKHAILDVTAQNGDAASGVSNKQKVVADCHH